MKATSTNPRVLLCTSYRRSRGDYLDFLGGATRGLPKLSSPCRLSPGLRFIKQNVPEVEILEYPLWHEYVAKLKEGWDVVGFSAYQRDIAEIESMAEEARRQGVRETWAGNFGVLDDKVPSMVDRTFVGPAEDSIAQFFGHSVPDEDIEHPAMMVHVSLRPGNIRHFSAGLLYTQRGCPYKCTFCQTPAFDKRRFSINYESIERVLRYYRKVGIKYIFVMDEIFGADKRFTDSVTRLLSRYNFHWLAQSRASLFLHNLDEWYERGLRITLVGVESMSQSALESINKKQSVEEVAAFARRTAEKPGMFRFAYYLIGYEGMNAEETLRDAQLLNELGFDSSGVCVLTPYPQTPLWDRLEAEYGTFDPTYAHYNSKHLVWNNPHISAEEMQTLLTSVVNLLNDRAAIYAKIFTRLLWPGLSLSKPALLWRNLVKVPVSSYFINDRKQFFFPKLGNDRPGSLSR
ncbi:MAG: radical SAM protein [bacterium]